jgi:uncharacterized Zn finger protein
MAISVQCDNCGKRLNVRDELIGKKVKCPACKNAFKASPTTAIKVKKMEKGKQAKVSISWGPILMITGAVLVVGFILMIVFGPVRAKRQWDPMAAQAESDVRDVVQRGLELYLINEGLYNPRVDRQGPTVHDVHMLWDMMVMGLPEHIRFMGTTNEGEYTGTYNTKTLEVEADVEVGGFVVPGVGEAAKKGDKTFNVKGKVRDGQLEDVLVNGKKLEMPSGRSSTQPTAQPRRARPVKPDKGEEAEKDPLPVAPGL